MAELDRFLAPYLYKKDDIFAKWTNAKTQEERFWAIYHAGVAAASEFDAQFIDLFRRAFADSDREVRLATVWAASYIAWPKMKTLVEDVATSDPDAEVRETAARLIEIYKRGIGMK